MAVCRFGWDSDVYVYYDVTGGIVCSRCSLESDHASFKAQTEGDMLVHLGRHVSAGHKVSVAALEDLGEIRT